MRFLGTAKRRPLHGRAHVRSIAWISLAAIECLDMGY
jgi:hypothetical protein